MTSVLSLEEMGTPLARLGDLLDAGSAWPLPTPPGCAVSTVLGAVDGRPVIIVNVDDLINLIVNVDANVRQFVNAVDIAVRERCPVIGVWSATGIEHDERVVAALLRASGRVPQISVLLDPPAHDPVGCGLAFTDVVLAGPDALRQARHVVSLLARPGRVAAGNARAVLDGELTVLHPQWAPGVVTALGRGDDGSIGVLRGAGFDAHDIGRDIGKAGLNACSAGLNARDIALDACDAGLDIGDAGLNAGGAEKAARFVRMCDAFGLPLVVDADGLGSYGLWNGARLLRALLEATVPRITLLTRESDLAMHSTSVVRS
jgi:acetyl-CoA/propionyl-CoA carboxylase carboxyl transferase subunit